MILVVGLGFVGLTTALGFSDVGFNVYAYDIDLEKTSKIKNNKIPFYEPNLEAILNKNSNKTFFLSDNLKKSVKESEVIFICVGTPSDDNGKADISYIKSAIKSINQYIEKYEKKIIVIKSTIPPSTIKENIIPYVKDINKGSPKEIYIASNPEFLREGYAWDDFIHPDRVIIGVDNNNQEYVKEVLNRIYKPFINKNKIHFVTLNTAEFIKYLSNSFLATLISFSNEMSMIAKSIGDIDIKESFKILHEDKRFNGSPCGISSYVYPGCGFGGYCLPKDTKALMNKSLEYDYEPKILKSVLNVNQEIKEFLVNDIIREEDKNRKISILGLSFKADSDDVRDTPSKEIIKLLLNKGYLNISVYDPLSNNIFKEKYKDLGNIEYKNTLIEAIEGADIVIILTAWKEFKDNADLFKNKKVYDLRYIL